MKKISIILSLAIAGILAAPAAHAATAGKDYIASYAGRTDIPVPVEVVSPSLTGSYDSARVELKFVVDETGAPKNISVTTPVDKELAAALTEAVHDWKFSPAKLNGVPVAKTVVLPFLINE